MGCKVYSYDRHELQKTKDLLDRKAITINEVRIPDGLDPVEWGDLPIAQAQDVPFDGNPDEEEPVAPPQPKPKEDEDEEQDD